MTSVLDLARLAEAVYAETQSVMQWDRVGQGFKPNPKDPTGFKSALYQNRDTADYVLAIAGTYVLEKDDLANDWNIFRGKMPKQYKYARDAHAVARQLASTFSALYLTGHSLGGGLSSMLAAEHGNPVITFNAPGMESSYKHFIDHPPEWMDKKATRVADNERKILHIVSRMDLIHRGTGAHMGGKESMQKVSTGGVAKTTIAAGLATAALAVIAAPIAAPVIALGGLATVGAGVYTGHSMGKMLKAIENQPKYCEPLDWA